MASKKPSALLPVREHAPHSHILPVQSNRAALQSRSRPTLLRPSQSPLQRKPLVSSPTDSFEREADVMADRVLRMAAPASLTAAPPAIQRNCPACEEKEKGLIQTRRAPSVNAGAEMDTGTAEQVARRPGTPLSREARSYFEPRFGHDLSAVRIHSDSAAAEGARAVQARAYTLGHNIVFGSGEYAPTTGEGRRLLAHELTHVIQQSGGRVLSGGSGNGPSPGATGAPALQRQRLPLSTGRADFIARKPTEACFDPGKALHTLEPTKANIFGTAAEIPLFLDYCRKMNCSYFKSAVFGGLDPSDDFFDHNNTGEYLDFIDAHNPHLTVKQWKNIRKKRKGLRRPDILSHHQNRQEYYEVKPNTSSGRQAGKEKMRDLNTFYRKYSLPYKPGDTYKPTPEMSLSNTFIGRVKVEIFLRVKLHEPGLIVYDLCARGDLKKLAEDLVKEEVLKRMLQAAGHKLKVKEKPVTQPSVATPAVQPNPVKAAPGPVTDPDLVAMYLRLALGDPTGAFYVFVKAEAKRISKGSPATSSITAHDALDIAGHVGEGVVTTANTVNATKAIIHATEAVEVVEEAEDVGLLTRFFVGAGELVEALE